MKNTIRLSVGLILSIVLLLGAASTAQAMDCSSVPTAPTGGVYPTCSTPPITDGQTCPLFCNDGYSHVGTDPVCVEGAYSGSATCTPATCTALSATNISSNCGTAPTGSICTVQCSPGTHRSDGGMGTSVTGTCTGTGVGTSTWTYPTFTCEEDPCSAALPPPTGGSYPSCPPPVPSGQTCPLACANGYTKVGPTDPYCYLGAYAGNTTTCDPATCAPIVEPNIQSDCLTAPTGSTCTVQCSPGTHRSDGGMGTSVTGTCTGTGVGTSAWTHPTFTCEEDPCNAALTPPTGGSYPSCPPPVPSGQTCPLACADGYTKSGPTDPYCYLGAYAGITTTCTPATCAPLIEPSVQSDCGASATGSTCTLQCAPGSHRTDGGMGTSVTGTCTGNGVGTSEWTHSVFTCAPETPTITPSATVTVTPTVTSTPTTTDTPTVTATPSATSLAGCPVLPSGTCRTAGMNGLSLRNDSDSTKRQLKWKWNKGDLQSVQSDFGDPVGGSSTYSLCLYDELAGLAGLEMGASLISGGDCSGTPCWKAVSDKGYSYKDKSGSSDGITLLKFKSGPPGKTSLKVVARGSNLPLPNALNGTQYFAQDTAVIVQLHAGANCWTSSFGATALKKNDGTQFKAKSP